jgi:hypothetical protein
MPELLSELRAKDCEPTRKLRKQELQAYATQKEVVLELVYEVVEHGWVGQPKGLLQVLWERGHIDEQQLDKYVVPYKNGDPFSLRWLMASCEDFASEKSAMEYLCDQMSCQDFKVEMLLTPKYHCELAGEGIEYSWGVAKRSFRMLPLARKRRRENFHASVRQCLGQLTVELARKLSARARRYMLTYRYYHMFPAASRTADTPGSLKYADIEKYVKKELKSHRNIGDQEHKFISKIHSEATAVTN